MGVGAPVKKAGGGLKKLAPPPGFKGKPKANSSSAGVDLLGGDSSIQAPNASLPSDIFGGGSDQQQPAPNSLDALLASTSQA